MRPLPLLVLPLASTLFTTLSFARDTDEESPPNVGYALHAGVEVGARWFEYSDPLVVATNLRPYEVTQIPLLTVGGTLRPLAWTQVPVLHRVSFNFDYAFASSFESATNDARTIATSWDHGDALLHIPVRLGQSSHAPQIGATIGYGWLGFNFSNAGALAAEIPSVTYRFVRVGATFEVPLFKRIALTAGFDYLNPLSGGNVYDRFRDVIIDGIDARAGFSFEFARNMRVFLLADYMRYFSSFKPVPGDAYVAGGALDQFLTFKVGFEYGR